jgi:hypothetical protein
MFVSATADVQPITARQTDRYPGVSFPAATGNGKLLAVAFPAAAFSASATRFEGAEMKIVCSFSQLLRAGFWLTAVALVTGLALGGQDGPAPAHPRPPVVAAAPAG